MSQITSSVGNVAHAKPVPATPIAVTLECSFQVVGKQQFRVHARIVNAGNKDIYVFDRIWKQNRSGKIDPDPERFYRYERDGELRLLLGAAPMPRFKTVTYQNIPFATLVKAGSILELDETMSMPVKEYSVYFPETSQSGFKPAKVNRILLIVQFVESQPAFRTSPCPFDAVAVKFSTPGVLDFVKTLIGHSGSVQLEMSRRTDEFDRLALEGEIPEPPLFSK
jgi:hypothetical protein